MSTNARYEVIDYTESRDICHIEEDIQTFTQIYEQENPDCTLQEYLEQEVGAVPYYERKDLEYCDIIKELHRHI